ncbi:MAG: carboxypeptidase regulatory-like domain-containing protein, partial [Pyrinomonadaceae bacterium]
MIKLPDFDPLQIKLISAFLTILATALVTCAQVPPSPNPQTEPPRFSVKGRVVYDNTDRPVRRSPISLIQFPDRGGSGEFSSATDRAGRFVIDNVPAGIYFVLVNSPGIITPLAFMSLNDKGPPETLNLKAIKEYCTEVVVDGGDVQTTVHARRGGAISGKVTYSDGEPAINAAVAVIRRADGEMTRVITGFSASAILSLHTDDRGSFRMAGLPPGEYIVSASEKNTSPNRRNGRGMGFDEL